MRPDLVAPLVPPYVEGVIERLGRVLVRKLAVAQGDVELVQPRPDHRVAAKPHRKVVPELSGSRRNLWIALLSRPEVLPLDRQLVSVVGQSGVHPLGVAAPVETWGF